MEKKEDPTLNVPLAPKGRKRYVDYIAKASNAGSVD